MSLKEFHEVRFPLAVAFGAVGGPERRTEIVTLASGAEHRNAVWAGSRRRFDVGGAIQTLDELHDVLAFFEARRGPLHGFRFRDFTDDRSCSPDQSASALDQVLGVGDGVRTAFQLIKRYGDVVRLILKPVSGTVTVALDGTTWATGWLVDVATGLLEFDTPPAPDVEITAGFEFDCPVRFASDRIEASVEGISSGRIAKVELIELLGDV
ncbi:MAG: DUF2460 domain-containing protein [Pseudomonadota bacterium]